jgi:hypothetical protein
VYTGKEREAVSDMIPYMRLGYVTDPSEMQSVISSQGPVCPVSLFLVLFLSKFEECQRSNLVFAMDISKIKFSCLFHILFS